MAGDFVGSAELYRNDAPDAGDAATYDRYIPEYVALYVAPKPRFAALAELAG